MMSSSKNEDVTKKKRKIGKERKPREQREVRERESRGINKGTVLQQVGGMEEKGGGEREKARGFTSREKPTESKMKEGDVRVGGRQGKTGEEKEDAEIKE